MLERTNPALRAFVAQLGQEFLLAQVLIRRVGAGYELCHIEDRSRAEADLRMLELHELRGVAEFTREGAFRPLKSAPTLQSGWRIVLCDQTSLERALNTLYPGAIADWHGAQNGSKVTDFREFTDRQTGMYRITQKLGDSSAAAVIRAGCHARFCLKRRLWTVEGLPTDAPEEKSAIPCLEPCAILLEFARVAMRIEQEEKRPVDYKPGEPAALEASPETGLLQSDKSIREADFSHPQNPRRIQLVREKHSAVLQPLVTAK